MQHLTITSVTDSNYFWGAYLLVASLRQNNISAPVHFIAKDLSLEQREMLTQFGNVKLIPLEPTNPRGIHMIKAMAMLSAESKWTAWVDSDCMAIGDISPLLIPPDGQSIMRIRQPVEMLPIYRKHYQKSDVAGEVPKAFLAIWQKTVNQRKEPRLHTTASASTIILPRQEGEAFLKQWDEHMLRILPAKGGLVDDQMGAYHMSDESVLNSLLFFSDHTLPIAPFKLGSEPARHMAHFCGRNKPWKQWSRNHFYCYPHVQTLLSWAQEQGYKMPPIPESFKPSNLLKTKVKLGLERAKSTLGHIAATLKLR